MMQIKSLTRLIGVTSIFLWGCASQNEGIEVTGRLSIKGSSPHSFIALHDKEHKKMYKILNAEAYDITQYQNRVLTLRLKVIRKSRGIGFPSEVEVVGIQR